MASDPSVDRPDDVMPVRPGAAVFWYLVVVAVWTSAIVGWCVFAGFDLAELKALKPDEFGTFVGGAFAPLGFLLLVVGYCMQARALAVQSDALQIQGEQLRADIATGNVLAEQLRREQEARRMMNLPHIQITKETGESSTTNRRKVENVGEGTAYEVSSNDSLFRLGPNCETLGRGSYCFGDLCREEDRDFDLRFRDALGNRYRQHFRLSEGIRSPRPQLEDARRSTNGDGQEA